MGVNKAGGLLALLLALAGCGQEENAAGTAAVPDNAPVVDVAPAAEVKTDALSNAEIALAGRAEFMQAALAGCINNDYPELDKAKRQPFCDCLHTATYASMTDAEWVEWDAIMVEKGKIWGAGFEKGFAIPLENPPEPKANPELAQRIERFDADWQQRYTKNENACMQQLGVTVKLTYQP